MSEGIQGVSRERNENCGHEVRPLASRAVTMLADALGWSHPYARAVLNGVEMREPYLNVDIAQHIAHLQEPVNGR
jgi:hypothetical protein